MTEWWSQRESAGEHGANLGTSSEQARPVVTDGGQRIDNATDMSHVGEEKCLGGPTDKTTEGGH